MDFLSAKAFLTTAPPFRQLAEDIRTLYYDRDAKMMDFEALLSAGAMSFSWDSDDHLTACVHIEWDLVAFIEDQYGIQTLTISSRFWASNIEILYRESHPNLHFHVIQGQAPEFEVDLSTVWRSHPTTCHLPQNC